MSEGVLRYGGSYWCVKVPYTVSRSREIYLHADELRITPAGALEAIRKSDGLVHLAFGAGQWLAYYAASCMDGAPVSADHWRGELYDPADEPVVTDSKEIRRQMDARYDRTFIRLGRRDGFQCAVCGKPAPDLAIDHIHPVSKQGGNELCNLRLACRRCNSSKGNRTETVPK